LARKRARKAGEDKKNNWILEQYLSKADDEGNAYGVLLPPTIDPVTAKKRSRYIKRNRCFNGPWASFHG
jgi:hypothetical protein